MKRIVLLFLFLFPATAWASQRFAIVIGNDAGASHRARLWFAQRDATRFAQALVELGDFPEQNVVVLKERSMSDVRRALREMDLRLQRLRDQGERSLLLLYFSGHANAEGVELGEDRWSYREIREWVSEAPAHARVALVDACGAGGLTQVKGGRAVETLDFSLKTVHQVEGVAYIASTSIGEVAQESALLEGSFFTSHLEAALRGAGDANSDGQVTLTEAFEYTSKRTTADTVGTMVGPQHPTYAIRMSGKGDLVLSDLRRAEAQLLLPPAPGALYVIRDSKGVPHEFPASQETLRLGLPAGIYRVERRTKVTLEAGDVTLARGESRPLPPLASQALARNDAKGGGPNHEVGAGVGLNIGLPVANDPRVAPSQLLFSISASQTSGRWRARVRLAAGRHSAVVENFPFTMTSLSVSGAALWSAWRNSRVRFELGGEAGAGLAMQSIETGPAYQAPTGRATGLLAFTLALGPLRVGPEVAVGIDVFPTDRAVTVTPVVDLRLQTAAAF